MLIEVETRKSVEELREAIPRACANHAFGVLGAIDLRAKMAEKGVAYPRACLVFEVCNPRHAATVLSAEPAISTALPCRIAVYETADGRRRLATIQPTRLLEMFAAEGLAGVACEVESALHAILEEAA